MSPRKGLLVLWPVFQSLVADAKKGPMSDQLLAAVSVNPSVPRHPCWRSLGEMGATDGLHSSPDASLMNVTREK